MWRLGWRSIARGVGLALMAAGICQIGGSPAPSPGPTSSRPVRGAPFPTPVRPVVATTVQAEARVIRNTVPVGGTVAPLGNLTALVVSPHPGRLSRLAVRLGQQVRKGQAIAWIVPQPAPALAPAGLRVPEGVPPSQPAAEPSTAEEEVQFHLAAAAVPEAAAAGEAECPDRDGPIPEAPQVAPPIATVVSAPITGIVTGLFHRVGDCIGEDAPMLASIMDTRRLQVVAQAPPQADRALGRSVLLTPTHAGPPVRARVAQVSRGGGPGTVVTMVLTNPRLRLRAGQVVTGDLRLGPDRTAVMVPWRSVFRNGTARWVLVLGEDGRARQRAVTLGGKHGYLVEVRRGLAAGETVLVSGNYRPQ